MKNPIKIFRAMRAYVRFVGDLSRLDEVFALSNSLSDPKILQVMADQFRLDDTGARALAEKPRLGHVDLEDLRKLPEGTLGHAFAQHMFANGLVIESIPSLKSEDELTFVRAHLYETHDIWHAVTGFGADIPDELGLQAFYLGQFPARLAIVILSAGLLNTLFFSMNEADPRMAAIARGWLMGHEAKKLFGVRWNDLWETPLVEVRKQLGIAIEQADRTSPSLPVMQAAA